MGILGMEVSSAINPSICITIGFAMGNDLQFKLKERLADIYILNRW